MEQDYHTHSTYSDGRFLFAMVRAASEAGLSGIGISDHCTVSEREPMRGQRNLLGFNLDVTYERRRGAIEGLRERVDIAVHDAVEMDYDPREEGAIADFLDQAGFDYAIGSVHHLEDTNVHVEPYFAEKPERERRALVDRYFEKVVSLVESELFAVAAHPDLIERTPALRGLASEEHYRRTAEAFVRSRTVPELNAGRVLDDYGSFHPSPVFLDALAEHGVRVTVGTDSHRPEEVAPRAERIDELLDERGIEPVELAV